MAQVQERSRRAPFGTSGTPPGSTRREAFHFLAAPAPQCISNCVQLCSRFASGLAMQSGQEHTMRWRPSRYTPCSPLQNTGTCAVGIFLSACAIYISSVSCLHSSTLMLILTHSDPEDTTWTRNTYRHVTTGLPIAADHTGRTHHELAKPPAPYPTAGCLPTWVPLGATQAFPMKCWGDIL